MDEFSEKFQTVLVSYLTYALFFNGWWFKDVKHGLSVFSVHKYIHIHSTHKYKYTVTQKYRYTVIVSLKQLNNRLLHSRPGLFVLLLKIPFVQKQKLFDIYLIFSMFFFSSFHSEKSNL